MCVYMCVCVCLHLKPSIQVKMLLRGCRDPMFIMENCTAVTLGDHINSHKSNLGQKSPKVRCLLICGLGFDRSERKTSK